MRNPTEINSFISTLSSYTMRQWRIKPLILQINGNSPYQKS